MAILHSTASMWAKCWASFVLLWLMRKQIFAARHQICKKKRAWNVKEAVTAAADWLKFILNAKHLINKAVV